ncbi:MAG TPA: hypothetical protein VFR30_00625 [Lysobacter sp.]|nr:hypothetical protein [Lysobacter sp.]
MTPLLTCRTLALFTLLVLAACSPPQPPEKERPPEPTAAHTGLRDAIKEPLDKAKGVEADLQKAADEQQKAIDAATGG